MLPSSSRKSYGSYSISKIQGTPFPNVLLETVLTLPETEARVVCLVARETLGWTAGSPGERRAVVRMSYAEMKRRIGRRSSSVLSAAVESLVRKGVLEVLGEHGNLLVTAAQRQRTRAPLRFRIARRFVETGTLPAVEKPVDCAPGAKPRIG